MTPLQELQSAYDMLSKSTIEKRGLRADDFATHECTHIIADCPSSLGSQFDAHGIAKGTFKEQLNSFLKLLSKGIDKTRPFHTAPFMFDEKDKYAASALGTAGGAYKDGLAILSSDYHKNLSTNGVKIVLINDAAKDLIGPLSHLFLNIEFDKFSNAARALKRREIIANQPF